MKIKISLNKDLEPNVRDELTALGIEISDDADYELISRVEKQNYIPVKDANGNRLSIKAEEIVFLESLGRSVDIHTDKGVYSCSERLYRFEEMLPVKDFIRVSNSCIIAKKHVVHIRPSLSMKFILKMTDNSLVDVTRSYYQTFKTEFGI